MKIARISVKNFLGIVEAEIKPGDLTILSGRNRQGKSSFAKAIEAAFKGMTAAMIHHGAERSEIVVDLEDLVVTRVQTLKTQSVDVKTKEGFTRNAPQRFLNGLFGGFAFNPLAFLLTEQKDRKTYLLKAMDVTATREEITAAAGVDVPVPESGPALEQFAEAHRYFYALRTDINRQFKTKIAAADETAKRLPEGWKPPEDLLALKGKVDQEIEETQSNIASYRARSEAAKNAKETLARLAADVDAAAARIGEIDEELSSSKFPDVAGLEKRVKDLEAQLLAAREDLTKATTETNLLLELGREKKQLEAQAKRTREAIDKIVIDEVAPGTIATAEETLVALRDRKSALHADETRLATWNEAQGYRKEQETLAGKSKRLDELCELFAKTLPAKALAEAKLPIEGLAIDGDRILVGGTAIDDLSTSEQMNVTLSVARALTPKDGLKTICIDGWERLDEEGQAEFIHQAEGDGYQYVVTRVGAPRAGEIEISEGRVAAQ